MEEIYGLIIKRKNEEPYGFPMPLSEIDKYTTTYTEEEILDFIEKANIIPDLKTCSPVLKIARKVRNKWAIDRNIPIITDSFILSFSIEEFLNAIKNNQTYYNIIYSQLRNLIKKNTTSIEMKEAIISLKQDPQNFLCYYLKLSYPDKRKIRTTIASSFDILKILNKKENTLIREKNFHKEESIVTQ